MYGQNPYAPYQQYNGYGYPQRAYAPQQQFTQPQPQQQPSMQYEVPINDIRFATSEEAKAFIVMPNTKALLIDRSGGMAHLKSADNMGQSVTQYFRFEQVNADGTPITPKEPTPNVDFAQFAKKEELKGFVTIEKYNELLSKLDVMQKLIVGGKQNGNGTNNAKQGN